MSCYGIDDTLEALKGRILTKAEIVDGKLVMSFKEGEPVRLGVEGDCCSSSRMIDAQMRSYIEEPLSGEVKQDETALEGHPDDESVVLYHTRFLTDSGQAALSVLWVNGSNGYYGGYWVNA